MKTTVIIGLLTALIVMALIWIGVSVAWALVIILALVVIGLLIGFVIFATNLFKF